jgi:pimeloyl-ACP methyl ester carboxylesterase
MIYQLAFRKDDSGGPVVPGQLKVMPNGPEGPAATALLALEPRVTFLIHGFNVNREEGATGLGNLAQCLNSALGAAVVSVLWPGDHWLGPLSYPSEGRDADDTAAQFARFIGDVVPPLTSLSFVTHSMGARVAMETIERLLGRAYRFDQLCLMAPAVDDTCLASLNAYRATVENCNRVAVLSSKEDEVLKYAYPAGDLLQAFAFWHDTAGSALGYRGPRSHDPSGGVPDNVLHKMIGVDRNSDHGDYIPEFAPGGAQPDNRTHRNQESAARFADQVIGCRQDPDYV